MSCAHIQCRAGRGGSGQLDSHWRAKPQTSWNTLQEVCMLIYNNYCAILLEPTSLLCMYIAFAVLSQDDIIYVNSVKIM